MKLNRMVKWLLLLAMVCFLFPFVTVSCSGETIEASGVELMTAVSANEEFQFDEDDPPNPYLIAAFILGMVGFISTFDLEKTGKKVRLAGCCGACAAALLMMFRSTFWEFYKLVSYEGQVTVEFRWGWMLSLLSNLLAGGCAFLFYYFEAIAQKGQVGENKTETVITSTVSTIEQGEKRSDADATGDVPLPMMPEQVTVKKVLSRLRVKLHINYGAQETEIVVKTFPYRIGRDSELTDLTLKDEKVSHLHAQITLCGGTVLLEDLGTSDGTRINGKSISKPTEVRSGDVAMIGTTQFTFEIVRPDVN